MAALIGPLMVALLSDSRIHVLNALLFMTALMWSLLIGSLVYDCTHVVTIDWVIGL